MFKEVQGTAESARGLTVPAKNEVQGIADAAPAEIGQHFSVLRGLVKPFVHALEGVGIEALDADVDVQEAAALGQVQELSVIAQVGRPEGGPTHLEGYQRLHQLHCMAPLAAEVTVTEENAARAAMFDFFNDFSHRPASVTVPKQESLGAEVAAERAAPRRDDGEGPEWTIASQVQQVVTGHGQAGQVGKRLGLVMPA